MVDVALKEDQHKELVPHEVANIKGGEFLQDNDVRHVLKRKKTQYYDRQQ